MCFYEGFRRGSMEGVWVVIVIHISGGSISVIVSEDGLLLVLSDGLR